MNHQEEPDNDKSTTEQLEVLLHKVKALELLTQQEVEEVSAAGGSTQLEKVTEVEENTENDNQIIEAPTYGPDINPYNVKWLTSSPIVLYGASRPGVNIRSAGILLDEGFYKLEFTFVNVYTGFGVALFHPRTKQFLRLLGHNSTFYKEGPREGEQYHLYANRTFKGIHISIETSGLVGLTDGNGTYLPRDFKGMIFVTVHKYKTTPN